MILALALALLLGALYWKMRSPAVAVVSAGRGEVLLTQSLIPGDDTNTLVFEVLNNSSSTLVCPDSWYVESSDGRTTMLSMPRTGNLRVEPGEKKQISIARPVLTNSWRLGTGYYLESPLNNAKIQLSVHSLDKHLPESATSVQGKLAVSDWVPVSPP